MTRNVIRGYFEFNKQQKFAVVLIAILLAIGIAFSIIYNSLLLENPGKEIAYLQRSIDSLNKIEKADSQLNENSLFYFDPNTISIDSLLVLGFPKKTAITLINYRKYTVFKEPADLEKVYGLKESFLKRIRPFVKIEYHRKPKFKNEKKWSKSNLSFERITAISVNKSDSSEWKKIYGIGAVLSKRIVKYRQALGGFVSTKQIAEVYGINEELFQSINPYLILDKIELEKININNATFQQLVRHPYINSIHAKGILRHIQLSGNIESTEEFRNI